MYTKTYHIHTAKVYTQKTIIHTETCHIHTNTPHTQRKQSYTQRRLVYKETSIHRGEEKRRTLHIDDVAGVAAAGKKRLSFIVVFM